MIRIVAARSVDENKNVIVQPMRHLEGMILDSHEDLDKLKSMHKQATGHTLDCVYVEQ